MTTEEVKSVIGNPDDEETYGDGIQGKKRPYSNILLVISS